MKGLNKDTERIIIFCCLLLLSFCIIPLHAEWTRQTNGIAPFVGGAVIDACDDNTAVFVARDPVSNFLIIYRTTNGGSGWQATTNPDSMEWISDISITSPDNFWVSTATGIFATSDGGQSWQLQFRDTTLTPFINYIEMFDNINGVAMADAIDKDSAAVILKTTDGGQSWLSVNDSAFGSSSYNSWHVVDFVDMNVGFLRPDILEHDIFKTTDGGVSWQRLDYPSDMGECVNLKFFDENFGIISGWWGQALYTEVEFSNWIPLGVGAPIDIEYAPDNSNYIWVASYSAVFYSVNKGRTWFDSNITDLNSSSNTMADMVFSSETHGWVLSNTAVYRTTDGGRSTTAIKGTSLNSNSFRLHPNYPNPFNATTQISFDLPNDAYVCLTIYDIRGREIVTLVNERQNAGSHRLTWSGSDSNRRAVPTGVYLLQMESSGQMFRQKMVLLK